MNNMNDKTRVFSLEETRNISLIAKIIAAVIIIFSILTQNGTAIICIFVIAIPLLLMAFSINTSDEIRSEKQIFKIKLKIALDKTAYPVREKKPPSNYLFSVQTLYFIAVLITIFGVFGLASGEPQSANCFLVSIVLANHAHQR